MEIYEYTFGKGLERINYRLIGKLEKRKFLSERTCNNDANEI